MIKKLFVREGSKQKVDRIEGGTPHLDRLKASYAEWRVTQDIGAVMSALGRLSDRQLTMIGLRRDSLYDAVTEMMERVEEQARIADEVLDLLDKAPAKGALPAPQPAPADSATDAQEQQDRAAA